MHMELLQSRAATLPLYWMRKHCYNDLPNFLDNVQIELEMFQGPIFSINVRKSH